MSLAWLAGSQLVFNGVIEHADRKATAALDYACRMLINTAKTYGPYHDWTSRLRNGFLSPRVFDVGGGEKVGIVANRMEYAPHVEFKPGYWVISGAFLLKQTELLAILGGQMDMSMLDVGPEKVIGSMAMDAVADRFKAGIWLKSLGKGTTFNARTFTPASFVSRTGGKWR